MPLRFRVVKLTKALKPEKSAQKRVQVSAQASDIRIFALTASAVRASSWRFRGRGARARTCELVAAAQIERHESGAVREHIQRSWRRYSRSIGASVRNLAHVGCLSAVRASTSNRGENKSLAGWGCRGCDAQSSSARNAAQDVWPQAETIARESRPRAEEARLEADAASRCCAASSTPSMSSSTPASHALQARGGRGEGGGF